MSSAAAASPAAIAAEAVADGARRLPAVRRPGGPGRRPRPPTPTSVLDGVGPGLRVVGVEERHDQGTVGVALVPDRSIDPTRRHATGERWRCTNEPKTVSTWSLARRLARSRDQCTVIAGCPGEHHWCNRTPVTNPPRPSRTHDDRQQQRPPSPRWRSTPPTWAALAAVDARLLDWPLPAGCRRLDEWVNLPAPGGGTQLAFQRAADFVAPTWPRADVQQQLHIDFEVADLDAAHERACWPRRPAPRHPGVVPRCPPVGHPFCLCAG